MWDMDADGSDVQEDGRRCEAMPCAWIGVCAPDRRRGLRDNDGDKGGNCTSEASFPPCEGGRVELMKVGEVWLGEARAAPLLNEELPLCCGPSDHG